MTALHRSDPRILGPLPGPLATRWLRRDDAVMSPSYTRTYPLVVRRGSGAMIEDVDGNRFLDFTAGIAVTNAGHSNRKVVEAIARQARRLIHMSGTDFYYEPQVRLAERLARRAPGPEAKRVFFTNSGAEAVEAALKLARRHTGRNRAMAFLGAFHGRTYGALSLSGSKPLQRRGFAPLVPEIHHARYGDLESVRVLLRSVCPPEELAAIFVEPIQGEGGYVVPPAGFLPGLRALCDEHGILLVLDEVQSGFGRTGKLFASEHWGVAGDIVCLAKGIANGLPLGAIVAKADVMDWPSGSHASTFGGNPVACAAALASLKLIERRYLANCVRRGVQLRLGLEAIAAARTPIKEVRGLGLMIGAEIRGASGEPDPHLRDRIIDLAFHRGLLLLPCGPSTIRFCPPLCLTPRQVEIGLSILDRAIEDAAPGALAEAGRSAGPMARPV
ncbi:5-aminovalerate aminotransferase DavT [Aquisphaera giovannonii]|uniref:5-aminovalerate aminotransferase DavT n=1 Tax=Aquisphaera giovannonii TaxID=406548 RepID=A0A5B9VYK7_9BACT|nr:acetyl ornithine aminotransferase family protein [Aquisphaera giovannonii]QEH33064.1 5-aminovalerate aminotransferase DavT [Aquisphaera giovannonii]